MCKGLCGLTLLSGIFVGVFVGALSYKLIKKTGIEDVAGSEGFQAARTPFGEEHPSGAQPSQEVV